MVHRLIYVYRAAYSGLPAPVWWLSGGLLISRAGTMVAPFLTLYLTQEIGLSKDGTGVLIVCYGAGAAGGALVGGWLSDRVGPRVVMVGSLLLAALGLLALGTLRTFWQFVAGLFLLALVSESFRPANASALALACPPHLRSRGFALQRLALNAGMTIGPAIGGYLAEVRYGLLFWANAAGCVAAALFLYSIPNFSIPTKSASDEPAGSHSPWADTDFMLVMFFLLCNAVVFFQLFVTLPVYLNEAYGLSEHQVGWVYAANTLFIIVAEMVLVLWLDRYAKLRVVAAGCLFVGLGYAMLPWGTGFFYAICSVVVWTIGEMLTAPFAASYAAGRAPPGSVGKYMAVFALVLSVAHMIGPFAGLLVYEHWGPVTLWYLGGLLSVAIVPGLWVLARK